jgi:hypothetical protein
MHLGWGIARTHEISWGEDLDTHVIKKVVIIALLIKNCKKKKKILETTLMHRKLKVKMKV